MAANVRIADIIDSKRGGHGTSRNVLAISRCRHTQPHGLDTEVRTLDLKGPGGKLVGCGSVIVHFSTGVS